MGFNPCPLLNHQAPTHTYVPPPPKGQGCETQHPTSLVRGCNICKHVTQFNSTEKIVESITGGQGRGKETKRNKVERVPHVFRKVLFQQRPCLEFKPADARWFRLMGSPTPRSHRLATGRGRVCAVC